VSSREKAGVLIVLILSVSGLLSINSYQTNQAMQAKIKADFEIAKLNLSAEKLKADMHWRGFAIIRNSTTHNSCQY
jgi:hypothetical protein